MDTSIRMVVPRICGTCVSCSKIRGRYKCSRFNHTFDNGTEFTSVCDEWKQGVLLNEDSVHTETGKEPYWLTKLREALDNERETARFYYNLHEESAKRNVGER